MLPSVGMRRTVSLGLLAVAAAGLVYVVRARGIDRMLLQGTRLGAPPSAVTTPWKTEEEWLAGEVARDIVEMAHFARHGRPPAPGDVSAEAKATGAPGTSPLRITIHAKATPDATLDLPLAFIWDPTEHAAVARLAADRLGLRPQAPLAAADAGSLAPLAELTPGVVEAENHRVSALLSARPWDSAAHESAALVLAALALREAAGLFHDVRPALCRMAAHLAVAEASRQGPPTADGAVAATALAALAERGAAAELAVAALPGSTPAQLAWRNALAMRVTDDWRLLKDPDRATLIERMAYVRAAMRTGTHALVLDHLGRTAADGGTYREVARMAMEDSTLLTVEAGNTLLDLGRKTEEAALSHVYRMAHGGPLADADRPAALTGLPERCVTPTGVRVIGWGTWSAFFRRHLLHQLTSDEMHMRHMLGLPDEADARGRRYDAAYGSVPQYSFLQDRRESHGGIRPTRFAESIAYTIDQPEHVSAFNFFVTEDLAAREVIRRGPAARAAWFSPPLPRGTTFDFRFRRQALSLEPKGEAAEALRLISPRHPAVLSAVASDHPKGTPVTGLERRLGPRLDYDVTLLGLLAEAAVDDRAQLGSVQRRLCATGPRWCGPLGVFLAEEGREDEAAVEVRKAFETAADRVGATWYAPWLVRYYTDRRRIDEAEAVALRADETGSGSGMRAMAALYERTGRFSEAEQTLEHLRARYGDDARADPPEEDDDDLLIAFYHRMANVRGDQAYAQRFRSLSARAFPKGVEALDPATLTPESAQEGVAILKASATTRRLGLVPGDVIVGVDGYRVRSARQYHVARYLSDKPEMVLHVWRYPGYREVRTRTWGRWLDTDLRTNRPGEATVPG